MHISRVQPSRPRPDWVTWWSSYIPIEDTIPTGCKCNVESSSSVCCKCCRHACRLLFSHPPKKTKLQSKARTLCQCGFDKWLLTLLIWRRLTSNVTHWGTWSPGDRLDPHIPALWLARRYPLSSDCAAPAHCTENVAAAQFSKVASYFGSVSSFQTTSNSPTNTHTHTIPWCAIFHILISTAWLIEKSNLVSLHVSYECARMFFGPPLFLKCMSHIQAQPCPLWHISVANFKSALMVGCMRRFQLSDRLLFALLHLSGFIAPAFRLSSRPSFARHAFWRELSRCCAHNLFLFISQLWPSTVGSRREGKVKRERGSWVHKLLLPLFSFQVANAEDRSKWMTAPASRAPAR